MLKDFDFLTAVHFVSLKSIYIWEDFFCLFCESINSENRYGYYLYLRKPHTKSEIVDFCLHSQRVVLFVKKGVWTDV